MQKLLAHVRELADELEGFPIGQCSPSDDPDKQTAYLYAFREIAMNHVPPIFGVRTFAEVVAQSGRSAKRILELLEDSARPLSDFHNHMPVRHKEILPSRGQVEPYRGSFEILISEVIARGETS